MCVLSAVNTSLRNGEEREAGLSLLGSRADARLSPPSFRVGRLKHGVVLGFHKLEDARRLTHQVGVTYMRNAIGDGKVAREPPVDIPCETNTTRKRVTGRNNNMTP